MSTQYIPIVGDLIGLISEAVEDKDLRNKLLTRVQELRTSVDLAILQSTTHPVIDGIVKLVYALVALATPLGALAMMAFNLWCKYKGVELDTATEAVTLGGLPAWSTYRRVEKNREVKRYGRP